MWENRIETEMYSPHPPLPSVTCRQETVRRQHDASCQNVCIENFITNKKVNKFKTQNISLSSCTYRRKETQRKGKERDVKTFKTLPLNNQYFSTNCAYVYIY